jgi:tellurite resistance protein TehA-like permease
MVWTTAGSPQPRPTVDMNFVLITYLLCGAFGVFTEILVNRKTYQYPFAFKRSAKYLAIFGLGWFWIGESIINLFIWRLILKNEVDNKDHSC